MHKYVQNMQNRICINMHFQNNMHKYALYAEICIRINMPIYANLNMHKTCKNMQNYAVTP